MFTNNVDLDEMQHSAAFYLGLHCLQNISFRGCILLHSIWVFTVCKISLLGVSWIQRVNALQNMLSNFSCFCCRPLIFFKLNFWKTLSSFLWDVGSKLWDVRNAKNEAGHHNTDVWSKLWDVRNAKNEAGHHNTDVWSKLWEVRNAK